MNSPQPHRPSGVAKHVSFAVLLAAACVIALRIKSPVPDAPAPPAAEIRGKPISEAVSATNSAQPVPAVSQAVSNAVVNPPPPLAVAGETPKTKAANAEPPTAAAPTETDGFLNIGFDRLASFPYEMPADILSTNQPAPPAKEQIPDRIKAFNQKPIALKGFMLPLKVEGGLVTEMLIMRDQSMCCFGTVPKINEWVSVKMTDKGVKPVMDQAVTLFGKLHVGEMRENGYLVGIYSLDGEKMVCPED